MTDRIVLNLNESNDVRFDVKITSSERFSNTDGPQVRLRLVCEANDIEYSFRGTSLSDGTVQVIVPPMKQTITEGTYDTRLEVIVEDRYFVPLEFAVEFKTPLKVVAESVRVVGKTQHVENNTNVVAAVKITERPKVQQTQHVQPTQPVQHDIQIGKKQPSIHDMDVLLRELK